MKYILGSIAILVGIFFVIKTEWLVRNFGASAWAQKYLGTSGGTRLMYKLIGILIIIIALMSMTSLMGDLILAIFGRLFGLPS